jgi:acyl carrier protein
MSGAELERFLIEFVVEQTGYPPEMVELDADLEADLGIDSIKKAQLFGELADQFQIRTAEAGDLSLDDFPTLRHVLTFLEQADSRGPAAESPAPEAPSDRAGVAAPDLERFLIAFVVEQTGYPEEMVELDADLEADLGIDSIKKAQLFGELAEHFDIPTADAADLSLDDFPTLRHVMGFLAAAPRRGPSSNGAHPAGSAARLASSAPPAPAAPARSEPQSTNGEAPAAADDLDTPPAETDAMSGEELERFLVSFVVEQTGYPEEMVELDADLEADLGIDSIKKAQLFGELAEQFEVRATDDLSLDDFPTLRHVMRFLHGVPRKMTV